LIAHACTGLNEDIGSWKMSRDLGAADRPHLQAVGLELHEVDGEAPTPPFAADGENQISPSTIRRDGRRSSGSIAP